MSCSSRCCSCRSGCSGSATGGGGAHAGRRPGRTSANRDPLTSRATPFFRDYGGQTVHVSLDQSIDLVCLSHLRWDFVWQRPQHLMSRCAGERRVFFVEEPVESGETRLSVERHDDGLHVVVPHIAPDVDAVATQEGLLHELFATGAIDRYVLWYHTPAGVAFTRTLEPLAIVYDCMDELSAFEAAPPELARLEAELLGRADVVFAGGQSLYEAKRGRHPNVHVFPSSVDTDHFAAARSPRADPADQAHIPRPRLGFYGVVDERFDTELIAAVAASRPDWQFVVVGPVVKIDPETLPRRANIHYLGQKSYDELPAYLAGWDAALLPFARNEATRFISPTKTPEYLAGGRPVISTPIVDVVRHYGKVKGVWIADSAPRFVDAIEAALGLARGSGTWLAETDEMLAAASWDRIWARMAGLIVQATRGTGAGRDAETPPH